MVPPKAFSADSFQFRQVGFASIEKSRVMQYTVHVLPYYPTNADAIVAHYLPYCPTFYTSSLDYQGEHLTRAERDSRVSDRNRKSQR